MLGRRRRIARAAVDGNDRIGTLIADAIAARAGGAPMTPDELPIVVACRDLIANTVGQLPMIAYRGNGPDPISRP